MSRTDSQKLEFQLFDDVEGMLKEHFQNNVHDQEANQAFLTASLKFLYRKLEKRLENVGSGISCKKCSSRTQSSIFSIRKQGEPSQSLPSIGYHEKVRHWASKYLHAGRTSLSRSSFSASTSIENVNPQEQNTSHRNLPIMDPNIHYGEKSDESGGSITSTPETPSDHRMLVIVSSEIAERSHDCEKCVSLNTPDTSTPSINDYQTKLLKNEYKDLISVDALMHHNAWKGQNHTKNGENVMSDKYFSVTRSLEVTAQESVTLDVNDVSNNEMFESDTSTAYGSQSVTTSKDPSSSETGYRDGIKDEDVFLRVSLSNPVISHDIARARPEEEVRSNAWSTGEVKKSRIPSSRIHAALFNLFGAKNSEKKSGSKSGSKSSKNFTRGNANPCKNDDTLKNIKRILPNKLSMQNTGSTVTSDQQIVKQNSLDCHTSTFSGKSSEVGRLVKSDTSSYSDQKSKLEKLKKLKVCPIPFVPVCQSCDQIYTYSFSGRTTRDVATCTEELITGYYKCKPCLSAICDLERAHPYLSKSEFREMPDKFRHRDETEELRKFLLYALLNDLRKCSRDASSKTNSKSKRRTSQFPDFRHYRATSWPRNIRRHYENRTKTQQVYEKCVENSLHKKKSEVLSQPSKFSAWNGDEKSSDSDDEEYRLKRHRLLSEHVAELQKFMSGKKLRSRVESSLVIKSSRASEHIPISKPPDVV